MHSITRKILAAIAGMTIGFGLCLIHPGLTFILIGVLIIAVLANK